MSDLTDLASPATQRIVSMWVVGGAFALMLLAESAWPLRRTVEPKMRRIIRNLTNAGVSLAILTALQTPVLIPVARWTSERGLGVLNLVGWPSWLEIVVAVVLLDYTLWWWHWASHKIPFLWRFHLVHHVDRDLDASTALRFHFGELTLSVGYRVMQIVLIGADATSVWVWQTILFVAILFHHANLRLPLALERWLVRAVVTPRMHGIHHSDRLEEANSNWSSLLSCWDSLHRTLTLNVPQSDITVGVPAYSDPRDVTIGKVLALPFVRQRRDWDRGSGALSVRDHDASRASALEA